MQRAISSQLSRGTWHHISRRVKSHPHLGSVGRDQPIPTSLRCVDTFVGVHSYTLVSRSVIHSYIARQSIISISTASALSYRAVSLPHVPSSSTCVYQSITALPRPHWVIPSHAPTIIHHRTITGSRISMASSSTPPLDTSSSTPMVLPLISCSYSPVM